MGVDPTKFGRKSTPLDGSRTFRPQDIAAPRHFGTTKLVPKFKTNHRWSCVSSARVALLVHFKTDYYYYYYFLFFYTLGSKDPEG